MVVIRSPLKVGGWFGIIWLFWTVSGFKLGSQEDLEARAQFEDAFFRVIKPKVACPGDLKVFGDLDQDGEWICLVPVGRNCTVYVSTDAPSSHSFETDFLSKFKETCEVGIFDPSQSQETFDIQTRNPLASHHTYFIGNSNTIKFVTLKTAMALNKHLNRTLDIFKITLYQDQLTLIMDTILKEFPEEIPVSQMLITLKVTEWNSEKLTDIEAVLNKLEKRRMRIFHRRIGNSTGRISFGLLNF